MNQPEQGPVRVICGMTEPTAQRYIVVRKELDIIIKRVYKSGYYLRLFRKISPEGLCKTLSQIGASIDHHMVLIDHYLDREFVSLQRVSDDLTEHEK